MTKKLRALIYGLLIILVIAILVVANPFKEEVWEVNANKFRNSFQPISGSAIIDDLSQWTPFQWDTLYSFAPYTPKEKICEVVGYKWGNIREPVNDGMNQIVFMKDNKVVCYLYGYPENNKLGFNFGKYEGSYIKLTSKQKLSFKTTISKQGVRYFDYIK